MSERQYKVGLGGDKPEPVEEPVEEVVEPVKEEPVVEPTKVKSKVEAKAETKTEEAEAPALPREVSWDRHAARMLEDPDYAEAFKDEE